ncbi:helix-turn-helix domain-containing protein [Pseudoclavibacter terrae]|uniref:helix-turn-helix domain-containing protein n=1 Tax=Pseudoclavibacter terrae TaxID=1530195 RepID=UPI00232D5364|nr:helix-turn-helix domain-containing protein [Pseudoclavibacter terrae]
MASPRIPASSSSLAREVQLSGTRAITWLREMGWDFQPSAPAQIFADLLRRDPFSIGRIWHTAGTATLIGAEHWQDNVLIAVFVVDGEQVASSGGQVTVLRAGDWLVQRLNQPLSISSTGPAARLIIVTEWIDHWLQPDSLIAGTPEQSYAHVFIQAANAALNTAPRPDEQPFRHLERALEELLASLLLAHEATTDEHPPQDRSGVDLRLRALELMRRHASEQAFDVEALRRLLDVGATTLYRAFVAADLTPARALRRIRVANARKLLTRSQTHTVAERTAIAHAVGFGSLRSMQRAMITELGDPGANSSA